MYLTFLSLIGLCIGSFLNVLISRLPENETLLGRSHCMLCKKTLTWWQLLPGVSFVLLRGRCFFCKKPISWQYPLVELLTAGLFLLVGWHHGAINDSNWLIVARDLFAVIALIVIGMIDALRYLILNKVLWVVGGAVLVLNGFLTGWQVFALLDYGIAAGAGFLFYWIQYALSKGKWVGGGDMKLALVLGVMLGSKALVAALLLAYIIGAVVSVSLMLAKKKDMKSEMPMGTFLAISSVVALLWGNEIVQWYLSRLGW